MRGLTYFENTCSRIFWYQIYGCVCMDDCTRSNL